MPYLESTDFYHLKLDLITSVSLSYDVFCYESYKYFKEFNILRLCAIGKA